jgi:hypothetical protein
MMSEHKHGGWLENSPSTSGERTCGACNWLEGLRRGPVTDVYERVVHLYSCETTYHSFNNGLFNIRIMQALGRGGLKRPERVAVQG